MAFRKKRLYLIKSTALNTEFENTNYRLLFAPRLKIKPRVQDIGIFLKKSIYKPSFSKLPKAPVVKYIRLKKKKIARLRRTAGPKKLNRWLSRRMLRGANRNVTFFANSMNKKIKEQKFIFSFGNVFNSITTPQVKKRAVWKTIYKNYYSSIHKRQKWKFSKIHLRRFNSKKFSSVISKMLNKSVHLNCINFFSYLLQKQLINFKTHQNHFWNFRYRRYRFQYKNYYDLVNAFLFLGVLDNTELFLFSVLKITLPLILKFRKFFKFLHLVIKYLPQIQKKFAVFKIFIAGKLAGGTKRTKFHTIGYGVLAVQSIAVNAVNNFMPFTHVYGEFGVHLLMSKRSVLGPLGKLGF